jgi:hypothetical protein
MTENGDLRLINIQSLVTNDWLRIVVVVIMTSFSCGEFKVGVIWLDPGHRIDIGQKVHSRVKSVPECQPTSGVAAMLKATKPEEIL